MALTLTCIVSYVWASLIFSCPITEAHSGDEAHVYKPEALQDLMETFSTEWRGHLDRLTEEMLQEQKQPLKLRSGWNSFWVGCVVTMIAAAALWVGCMRHWARKKELLRENEAEVILARYNHDSVRTLLTEVMHNKTYPPWLTFPDYHRVDWINSLIEQMWPKVEAAAVKQAHEALDPLLKANRPKWIGDISMPELTLGAMPPRIKGIKTFGGSGDDLILEMDAVWASSMTAALKIKLLPERIPVLPAGINLTAFLTKHLSKLIFVKMAVTDVGFSGRIRVVVTALSDTFPLADTVQVSLVELPRFSFGIRLLEYVNLMVLPGLESFIHHFIRDVLLGPYTLPEALTIPIREGASTRHPMPVGMLFVTMIQASDIPHVDWRSLVSKPDCFVELSVRNKSPKSTRVIWNQKSPRWDESFKFLVHHPEHQVLQLVLRDYDRVLGATEVGRAHVPIQSMPTGEEQRVWVDIQPTHKGFGSLQALQGAMRSMKNSSTSVIGGHGTRVAHVEDAGGMGFADVYTGAPQVQEVVPPSEMESDNEASLAMDAASNAASVVGADSRRSSGEHSIAHSTIAQPADSRQSALDKTVTAARGQKQKEPCRLQLSFLYVQVGTETVQKAQTAGGRSQVEAGSREAQVLSALRGGVLEVKVLRASPDSKAPTARQVVVKVGKREKATEAAGGSKSDNVKGLDQQEEVLEFVVDGDVADQPDALVELQVFDMHWISDTSDVALWGLESKHQMATKPAVVSLPLSDIIHSRSLHKAWQVGGGDGSRMPLLLDAEFEWLPVMDMS